MANSRKDNKGRKLRDGESQRKDGRYTYRYTDLRTGKRGCIYAQSLPALREKEKKLEKDLEDSILTDSAVKKMTLNSLFERYINSREIADTTRINYERVWNNRVKDEIGGLKVVQMLPSHVKLFYSKLSKAGYSHSTIKLIHNMVFPALELALDDDVIRKNPAKGALGDYGRTPKERIALTSSQQEKILAFIKSHNVYNAYYPMVCFMIGTGLRCGELIGLTWNDVDMKKKIINVDHQLIYKNLGDGCKFHITTPKTDAGVRVIPMLDNVRKALEEQRKLNFLLARSRDFEIEGYTDFIFLAKTGRPLMPNGVNSALKNIVDAYNRTEVTNAKKERRKAELFPNISAHIMRHTACTRMAEQGMDVKVLQYIMGHENIEVTMQVYNHISDMSRVENEIIKINALAVDF